MTQDILITPGSGEPQILFRGSGTNDTPIELNVLSSYQSASGSGTALVFEGTEGQLFAVTDNLSSGVIFSVGDITGLSLLSVDASGDVRVGEFGRYVGIGQGDPQYGLDVFSSGNFRENITASGSITAGSFIVDGGSSNHFLKGDGSLDNAAYITSGDVNVIISGNVDTQLLAGDNIDFTYDQNNNTLTISTSVLDDSHTHVWDNIIDAKTKVTLTELTYLSGVVPGTVSASRTLVVDSNKDISTINNITANSFIVDNGTSSQFLKADGSLDSNTYLTSHPSISAASSSNNSNRTYIQDVLLDSFGHVTGIATATETVTNTNTYVTSASFNTTNGIVTLTRNDAGTVTVDLDGRYLTSQTSHADVLVDGDFTTAGLMKTNGAGTYSIVTDNSSNWNTAYGWGDHSTEGYLTSNQSITLTGGASGTGTTSISVTIADDSHNHIISNVDGLQSALNLKAPLDNPIFTGTPSAPTATSGTNTTQIATTEFVRTEVSNLVASAPVTLDTLNELAAALGDDPNFATTVSASLGTKVAGTGTINYLPKFTASQTVGNSVIYENAGSIGINTTSPSGDFELVGDAYINGSLTVDNVYIDGSSISSTVGNLVLGDPSSDIYIGDGVNNIDLIFQQDGEIRALAGQTLTVGASGSDVSIYAEPLISVSGGNYFYIETDNGTIAKSTISEVLSQAGIDGTGSANHVAFWSDTNTLTYDSAKLYWDSTNDRLGIKTNVPSTALHIVDQGSSHDGLRIDYVSDADYSTRFDGLGSIRNYRGNGSTGTLNLRTSLTSGSWGSDDGGSIKFSPRDTDAMYIKGSNGNVGIGTTSPSEKLRVYGNVNSHITIKAVNPNTGTSAHGAVRAESHNAGVGIFGYADNYSGSKYGLSTGGMSEVIALGSPSGLLIGTAANDVPIVFGNDNTERMRIAAGGNVGIGTASPASKLQVNGTVTATSIVKSGGTSSQFLKADGSLDSSTYLTGNQTITLSGDASGSGTTSINVTVANDSHTHDTRYYTETEVGDFFSGSSAITGYNKTNWDTAYTWGNHASAGYLTSVGWADIQGGNRTNYNLVFRPTTNNYAGFTFQTSAGTNGGYFLIRGTSDADVYTAEGITLVADSGWLTLAQRTSSGKGVRLMTGATAEERLKIDDGGDVEFLNANSFIYNTNEFVINSNGDVGVGTASPNSTLHLYSATSGDSIFNVEGTNGSLFSIVDSLSGSLMSVNNIIGLPIFEVFDDDTVIAGRYGENDFYLSTSGDIGIGTSNPTEKLQIDGNIRVTGAYYDSTNDPGSNGQVLSSTATGTNWVSLSEIQGVDGAGTTNYVAKWSDADTIANSQIFDNGTNVGIGTTAPTSKLHIVQNTASNVALKLEQDNASYESYYEATSQDGGYSRFGIGSNANDYTFFNSDQASYRWYNVSTERMRLTSGGNLGIGETSPAAKLQVDGTIKLSDTAGNRIQFFQGGGSTNDYTIRKDGLHLNIATSFDDTTHRHIQFGHYNSSSVWQPKVSINGYNGNTGFGTTTPSYKIDVYGDSASWSQRIVGANSTGNSYGLIIDAGFNSSDEALRVRNRLSTADLLAVRGDGNVGVGTASPNATLHAYSATSGTTIFNAEGTNGSLFSVVDNLSGVLMSVNTIAGLPVLEVNSDYSVTAGRFNQNDFVVTASGDIGIGTANPTEKLNVNGNIHIPADSYIQWGTAGTNTKISDDASGNRTVIKPRNSMLDILNTAGTNWGTLRTAYITGGSTTSYPLTLRNGGNDSNSEIKLTSTEVVVNDNSSSLDFRVESDGNANMLFVDGVTNMVGIGKTPGNAQLDVNGTLKYSNCHLSNTIYNYSNGILITTNVPTTTSTMFELTIEGNVYGNSTTGPIFAKVHGYNYGPNTSIPGTRAISTHNITINALHHNGFLCFWLTQPAGSSSLYFKFMSGFYTSHYIMSITNVVKPTTNVTQDVSVVVDKIWTSSNDGSSSGLDADLLDGQHLSSIVSGTTNYISKFTGANSIGDSVIYDDGTNVGIGTATPSTKLHIYDSGTTELRLQNTDSGSSGYAGMYYVTTSAGNGGNLVIKNNNSGAGYGAISITSNNNVEFNGNGGYVFITKTNARLGIGTTNPEQKLHVNDGNIKVENPTTPTIEFDDGAVVKAKTYYDTTNETFVLKHNTVSGDEQLVLASGGQVGIGTNAPNAVLHAYGSTPSGTVFNVEGTNGSLFSVVDNLSGVLMSVNNNAGLPVFEVYDDDSIIAGRFNQNDLVITSSGDIGMGIAAPSGKLHVVGEAHVDNLKLDGNTLSSTNTNGNIILTPNGTGGIAAGTSTTVTGAYAVVGGGTSNTASDSSSTVSGGYCNTASGASSTIGGGSRNTASGGYSTISGGGGNCSSGYASTVSGGYGSCVSGNYSTVSGGYGNCATNSYSTVSGGLGNTASANASTVSGGFASTASATYSTVGGGIGNTASHSSSTVGGGGSNTASGYYSTIGGGQVNTASGTKSSVSGGSFNVTNARHSTINGGHRNVIQSPTNECCSRGATIGGGVGHNSSGGTLNATTGDLTGTITCCNAGAFSTIGGGLRNCATGASSTVSGGNNNSASASCSTVSGGYCNTASGASSNIGGGFVNTASGNYSTVGGGYGNCATNTYSTVSGGYFNTASGYGSTVAGGGGLNGGNSASNIYSTVSGGVRNSASGYSSTIGGGHSNYASASCSTVSGGYGNCASGTNSSVSGGCCNITNARHSTINGGHRNIIQSPTNECCSRGATIGGGVGHNSSGGTLNATTGDLIGTITCCNAGRFSTIGGGLRNIVTGGYSTVSGGYCNTASDSGSTISGGYGNRTCPGYNGSTIGGGLNNIANGNWPTVAGGCCNTASGYSSASVGGGECNRATGSGSTVAGGICNLAYGHWSVVAGGLIIEACGNYSAIVGGQNNSIASTALHGFIGGGRSNAVSGSCSTVSGGRSNTVSGTYSSAVGCGNNDNGCCNSHLIGKGLSATATDTTYTNNSHVCCSLTIGSFNHSNLSVASSFADTDLVMAVIDPTGTPSTEMLQGSVLRSSLLNQAATLQFRQGTDAERQAITPASGEPIWTTDTQKFYIGDGTTAGGDFIGPSPYDRDSGTQSIVAKNTGNCASGNCSTVSGGFGNCACGNGSTVSGGYKNVACGIGSVVAGGGCLSEDGTPYPNCALGNFSTVSGGMNNTASAGCATVGGGQTNTASASNSTVGGGYGNTASGYYSTVSGGAVNSASGGYSTVGGGRSNSASGYYSTVSGGYNNTASGGYSTVVGGYLAKASKYGELSHASGRFAQTGDAQHSTLVARRNTTDATANQVLFLNGSSQRLVIPAETTWMFEIKLAAHNDTNNDGAWWTFRGGIKRNAANGTSLIGSVIEENSKDTNMSTASASVVADDTNEALEIRVTGVASKNIRWVAVVDISQVSWGTP